MPEQSRAEEPSSAEPVGLVSGGRMETIRAELISIAGTSAILY
jgi:hypothetical protein